MRKTAVVLITDRGFLVPSLVVCKQLVAQSINEMADIIVYLVDIDEGVRLKLETAFKSSSGMKFEPFTSKSFIPSSTTYLPGGHLPVTALARLVLNEVLPPQYENLIYLDGDLQIIGDVSPLIRYTVPEGKIAAAKDKLWLERVPNGSLAPHAEYLAGLPGVDANAYFNTGVMAFRRKTWSEVAPKALEFFFGHSQNCKYYDQCALNVVCQGRLVELAPAYNFHHYANIYVQHSYHPVIIHFAGPNKPWKYTGLPWGSRFMNSYRQLLDQYPFLQDFLMLPKPLSPLEQVALYTDDGRKAIRYPRTFLFKRAKFFRHVKTGNFAF